MHFACRKTNPENAEKANKEWKDSGRKYTLTLVQPNGQQLELIAKYIEEVSCGHAQASWPHSPIILTFTFNSSLHTYYWLHQWAAAGGYC